MPRVWHADRPSSAFGVTAVAAGCLPRYVNPGPARHLSLRGPAEGDDRPARG
jgi:hypothetical protein